MGSHASWQRLLSVGNSDAIVTREHSVSTQAIHNLLRKLRDKGTVKDLQ